MLILRKVGIFIVGAVSSFLVFTAVFTLYCLLLGHDTMEWIFGTYSAYILAIWAGVELTLSVSGKFEAPIKDQPRTKLTHLFGLSWAWRFTK